MNEKEMVKKIQTDRIGDSCFYDAISCLLEYEGMLFWSLEYVEYKFLYEPDRFKEFLKDTCRVKSPTDAYYFLNGTGSCAYTDISAYTYSNFMRTLGRHLQTMDENSDNFYHVIKELGREGIPFCLKVNNMKYRDFYKQHGFTVPRSDCRHYINVFRVSNDGRRCFIYDRGFDCFGEWIDTDSLFYGATSQFLENEGKFQYLYFNENESMWLNSEDIMALLLNNMNRMFKNETVINGIRYLNNSSALIHFRDDLDDILQSLEHRYGADSAAMMGEAILLQVDGAMGLPGVYGYIGDILCLRELADIVPLLRKYWEIWHKFETKLKYICYKRVNLKSYEQSFYNYVDMLLDYNERILYNFHEILV